MSTVAAVAAMDIRNRIHPVRERPPFLKVCLYGEPGSGKTVTAARAPSPLIIDTEHGTRSLLNHPELANIPALQLRHWKEVEEVVKELRANTDPFFQEIKTVIVDSVSELQRKQMDEILKHGHAIDVSKHAYIPVGKDYQENIERVRRLIVSLRDLEKNLILTAHTTEDKDESDGTRFLRPNLSPKLSTTVTGLMDIVGYMYMEIDKEGNAKRHLRVAPHPRVLAKSRIGGLPPVIENPTFDKLLKAQQEAPTKGAK